MSFSALWKGELVSDKELTLLIDNLPQEIAEGLEKSINIKQLIDAVHFLGETLKSRCPTKLKTSLTTLGLTSKEAEAIIQETYGILNKSYIETKIRREFGSFSPFKLKRIDYASNIFESWMPLGAILHIAPGNSPSSGFLSVLEALICGNVNILKDTPRNGMFSIYLIEMLCSILDEIKPLIFAFHLSSKEEVLMNKLLNMCDGVSVWGGDTAISSIRKSVPPGIRLIEWGHKISFAYFTLNAVKDSEAMEALAHDICRMEQQACSSPQVLYIDTDNFNDIVSASEFFASALENVSKMYPLAQIDIHEQAEITTVTLMTKLQQPFGDSHVIEDKNLKWRILAEKNSDLKASPLYRTIWVKPLPKKNILKTLLPYRRWLQTVSLSCEKKDFSLLSYRLLKAGATRIVSPGNVFSSYPGEPHDGVFALTKYCKRVNLQDTNNILQRFSSIDELLPYRKRSLPANTPITDKTYFDNDKHLKNSKLFVKSGGSSGKSKLSGYTWNDYCMQMSTAAEGLFAVGFDINKDRCMNLFYCGHMYGGFLSIFSVLEKLGAVQFPMAAVEELEYVADFIIEHNINTLCGMPNYLIRLFHEQEKKLLNYKKIKKIFYAGEMFNPQQILHLKKTFNVKLIKSMVYGSNDIGPMGFACPYCKEGVHHLFTDAQILEIFKLNENKPVEKGEIGRLLFTPLMREGQNITRYEIGDLGRWVDEPCACGRTSPRFELMGRYGDIFKAGTNFLNYREFISCLSKYCDYSGLVQLKIDYESGRECITVMVDEKSHLDKETVYKVLTTYYKDLEEVVIIEPLIDLKIKLIKENEFVRTAESDKLISIIDNRKTVN